MNRKNPDTGEILREYEKLNLEQKQILHNLFRETDSNEFNDRYQILEKTVFKKRPPTPQEFLEPSNRWLPKTFIDSIFPHIKQDFFDILDQKKEFSEIVEYGCTRQGKSYLARLLILYTIVFVHHLRDPQLYFGLAPTTALAIYIISFKYEKVYEVYLQDLYNMLEMSERFIQTKFQDQVRIKQEEVGVDYIVYSKATNVGHLTLASGLRLVSGNNDVLSIIGANILQVYLSEIAFFIEYAGASEEAIFRLYSDSVERIHATVGKKYLAYAYLDTSANIADSVIESYILKELKTKDHVFFRSRSRWEARPELFPKWRETGETFEVITGNSSIPPKIITGPLDKEGVDNELIIRVPIDAKQAFERNLVKSIKDIAGRPTVSDSKFIGDINLINDMWLNSLPNIEGILIADSADKPEELLWNQVKNKFFTQFDGKNYVVRRAHQEPRFIGLDLAKSAKGDVAGICMLHKEWSSSTNSVKYVCDFCFTIGPGDTGINLDAIKLFIMDLVEKGRIIISGAAVDTAFSAALVQALNRYNIPIIHQSVDRTIDPYMSLYSGLLNREIHVGRNIFLKNNLLSLYRMRIKGPNGFIREKIDHQIGTTNNRYDGDFEKSTCGIYAKDCSDALCQAYFLAKSLSGILPSTLFEKQNERFIPNETVASHNVGIQSNPDLLKSLFDVLHKN